MKIKIIKATRSRNRVWQRRTRERKSRLRRIIKLN
jgi:hypothetical protein